MERTTEAQRRASRRYENRDAETRRKTTIDTYFRTAKMYILNHAEEKELKELVEKISEREEQLHD